MNELAFFLEKKKIFEEIKNVTQLHEQRPDKDWKELDFDFGSQIISKFKCTFRQADHGSYFITKVFDVERVELPAALKSKSYEIADILRIPDTVKRDIDQLLLKLYITNTRSDINISMSSEREFLIYIKVKDTFKNILIDEDGDVELLVLPRDGAKSYNKTYYKEDGINFSTIVSVFNEMQ